MFIRDGVGIVSGVVRALMTLLQSKIGVVSRVKHDGLGVGRVRTFPFSSDSAHDSGDYDPVKTRLSES